jgi:hypothetical protein
MKVAKTPGFVPDPTLVKHTAALEGFLKTSEPDPQAATWAPMPGTTDVYCNDQPDGRHFPGGITMLMDGGGPKEAGANWGNFSSYPIFQTADGHQVLAMPLAKHANDYELALPLPDGTIRWTNAQMTALTPPTPLPPDAQFTPANADEAQYVQTTINNDLGEHF